MLPSMPVETSTGEQIGEVRSVEARSASGAVRAVTVATRGLVRSVDRERDDQRRRSCLPAGTQQLGVAPDADGDCDPSGRAREGASDRSRSLQPLAFAGAA